MGIMDMIKSDVAAITGDGDGFGVALTFTNGTASATVYGLATKHSITRDTDGIPALGNQVHCSVSEQLLTAEDYPTRNADKLVSMTGHRVSWTDATGVSKTYVIKDCIPDDTVGLIVFLLGTYKTV